VFGSPYLRWGVVETLARCVTQRIRRELIARASSTRAFDCVADGPAGRAAAGSAPGVGGRGWGAVDERWHLPRWVWMMIYEIEITRFAPGPVASVTTTGSAAEVARVVRADVCEPCVVLVAHHDGAVSRGEFHIWLAAGRALVRLDEHREWHAMDPAWAEFAADGDAWFRDSDGTNFPAQAAETISRSQAIDVLAFWLATGQMLPTLTWV
jgi:hypothetical protein